MKSLRHTYRITPLFVAVALGCGAEEAPQGDVTAEAPAPVEGRELEGDDFVGIEQENVSFNLHWVDGPVIREPARIAPPLNEVREVMTVEGESFDRVIFALGDGQIPGYELTWAAEGVDAGCVGGEAAASPGRGERQLLVRMRSVTVAGGREPAEPRHDNLQSVALTCVLDNEAIWHFGAEEQAQVRVFEMHSPRRLVVDLRHP